LIITTKLRSLSARSLVLAALFCVLLGRGLQYFLKSETPLRTFIWSEDAFGTVLGWFGIPWTDFANSMSASRALDFLEASIGLFFLALAAVALRELCTQRHTMAFRRTLWGLVPFFFVAAAAEFKNSGLQLAHLVEVSAMTFTPLMFLVMWNARGELRTTSSLWFLRLVIALTFFGHGMYALGYGYAQPGRFIDMTISILHCDESFARAFLKVAGALDVWIAWICLTLRPIALVSLTLLWATIWGFATATARVWANFSPDFVQSSLVDWVPEMIVRLPHGLLPLALWLSFSCHTRRSTKTKYQ
jgi:hypothetical protein